MVRLACCVAVLLTMIPAAAFAADPVFLPAAPLPNSKPDGALSGAEPGVTYDPSGDGHIYANAPGAPNGGISFWASADGGDSWPIAKGVGSTAGGEDSDVVVGPDHTVYAADLEIAANAICRSTDFGKSFTDGCDEADNNDATNQTGPESDRPWLAADPHAAKTVYFVYHDLAAGALLAESSSDGGASWTPCGSMLEPGSSAQLTYSPSGGSGIGKPAVSADGTVYVPFILTSSRSPVGAYDSFFVAILKGGCSPTAVWHDVQIYSDPGADLAHFWPTAAVDGAGDVYAAVDGKATAADKGYGMNLWVSKDHGETWSKTIRVNTPDLQTNVLPALTGGLRAGQVALGWYGTPTTADATDPTDHWRYYGAESFDFGAHFVQVPLSGPDIHTGPICTLGVLCMSGRELLDFTSAATEPKTGCPAYVFGGDNSGSIAAFFTRQIGGPCLTDAPAAQQPATGPGVTRPIAGGQPRPSLGLPAAKRCLSRRVFRIRLRAPKGQKLRSARVTVAGRRAKVTRRKGRLTAIVDLRHARKGAFSVRVRAITTSGRRISETRTYHTCARKRS